jgi:hypothetical protein
MSSLYEDNFGFYAVDDDPEELCFLSPHQETEHSQKMCSLQKKSAVTAVDHYMHLVLIGT